MTGDGGSGDPAGGRDREGAVVVGPPDGVEVELKYRCHDPVAGERLLAATELAGFRPDGVVTAVDETDRYVDGPGGPLAAAGWACRIRRTAAGPVLALKARRRRDAGGATHRRLELEGPAGEGDDPAAWPPSPARDALETALGGASLVELVTIRQMRRRRILRGHGAVVELSVDEVAVLLAGREVDGFAEVEVELRDGPEAALAPLAELLAEVEELVPAERSKLDRALDAVAARAEAGAAPATPPWTASLPDLAVVRAPGVAGDDTLALAARRVLRFHLARMLARQAAVRAGTSGEELKAMRVAIRRQRAAWRVLGDAFDPAATARIRRRLRRFAATLGTARDLDVLCAALADHRGGLPPDEAAGLAPLAAAWEAERAAARARLAEELGAPAHHRWLDRYGAFLADDDADPAPAPPGAPALVREVMPGRIWTAYAGVRAHERTIAGAPVALLHELRIAAKWLRYTIEFVREPLGAGCEPVLERVVALQDHLGLLNDADVAATRIRAFLAVHGPLLGAEERAATERHAAARETERERLRLAVTAPWEGVAGPAFRRELAEAVAAL